jgi:hypothetical protein
MRPVARRIADARPRGRLVVAGTIEEAEVVTHGRGQAYRCIVEDGTGRVALLFLGRWTVPGMMKGARCTAEGIVRPSRDDRLELEVRNPLSRVESEGWVGTP